MHESSYSCNSLRTTTAYSPIQFVKPSVSVTKIGHKTVLGHHPPVVSSSQLNRCRSRRELNHDIGGPVPEPATAREQPAKELVFFPSISLVNSMPVVPEHVMQMTQTTSWDKVSKGGRRLDDRIKSAKCLVRRKPHHE